MFRFLSTYLAKVTPGLGEPHLEQTRAEAVGQEEEHEIDGNIAEELDDDEGVAQMEKGVDEAVEDEEIATKQVAKRGDVVEHLVEERLDRVDMEEVAEEGDFETADEEDEEEEAEADQGPTSEEHNMEVGQDEDGNEGDSEEEYDNEVDILEDEEQVETRDASQAQRTVDISQAELEMPPPGEHRFSKIPTMTTMTMVMMMKILVMLVMKVVSIMILDEDAIPQVLTRLKCQKSHEARQLGALPWHG